jgi:hypothetical protein
MEQYIDKLTALEFSLKHIMEEAIECGDTHNLKADADMLLRLIQNPTWSEEDKRMFDYALDMIEWYGGKNEKRVRLVSDWLKSLKQRIGE